jgi:hypothetical protein
MFYYKLFVVFTILPAVLSIPITKSLSVEPERCCVPRRFSSKISLSTGMVLSGGQTYTSYVIDFIYKLKFIFLFNN